jgi:hypothetical protein
VIRTCVPKKQMTSAEAVRSYKALADIPAFPLEIARRSHRDYSAKYAPKGQSQPFCERVLSN